MKIFVTMKSLARKKNYLTKRELHLRRNPETLREVLMEMVENQVDAFNSKETEGHLASFLTKGEVHKLGHAGKVGFEAKYNVLKANSDVAVNTAIQAFEDGLFKVYINEEEQVDLDTHLDLAESDQFTFIKLTMLAGRMW